MLKHLFTVKSSAPYKSGKVMYDTAIVPATTAEEAMELSKALGCSPVSAVKGEQLNSDWQLRKFGGSL